MKITNLLESTIASLPDPGQTAFRSGRSETSLEEMTAGGTVAGAVAPVSKPIGKVIKRESGITKGIKKKMVDEGELSENDLILVPGQMSKRSKGFVSKDRNEMERIEMAKSDVVQSVKSATAIFSILKNSDDEIEGWVQEKLAKAEDYLDTVREYLEGKSMPAEGMSAGVRMQRALQREKEKRERSERYAEKHFPIGKKPEQNTEPQKEVKEAEGPHDWMDDMRAMAHKMAPQDKMNQAYTDRQSQQQAKQQEQLQQDIKNLPDLISQFRDMKSEYESMGGSNWQYADNEQNLSDEERKARGMETSMRQLANRIRAAKEVSEGLAESKPDFAKMFNKKIGKHNAAVVKTKKEIGTRVADIGAGGKEYNVKTDKEWDKQKGVAEGSEKHMSKEVKAMATGKCPHCHGPVEKKEHPTLTQYHCAKCGIRASIDKQGVAEGISVVDQDYDLDQIVLTMDIEGKRVSFTYTDYEEDFENAERRDVFDQLQQKSWYAGLDHPTKMEILDAAYRAIRGLEPQEYRPTAGDEPLDEQGVAEGAKVDRMVAHVKSSEKKLGHSDKEAENIAWATANKRGMLDNKNKKVEQEVDEESKGLWANIHAKRERIKQGSGEKMRTPGSKGAPTADALRKSAK